MTRTASLDRLGLEYIDLSAGPAFVRLFHTMKIHDQVSRGAKQKQGLPQYRDRPRLPAEKTHKSRRELAGNTG